MGHADVKERLSSYLSRKPFRDVLLLHGPPGIGKTTMALAAARSANMEPLEINASQSMRSHEDVAQLINSCRHTRTLTSLIRGDDKAMCLILDEVDGSDPHAQKKLTTSYLKKSGHLHFQINLYLKMNRLLFTNQINLKAKIM
jgi:DNA polymerase III delta prime subunit